MKAFCFFGYNDGTAEKSIESLELGSEWKYLAFDTNINTAAYLASVLFKGSILVFGGPIFESVMYKVSEEGQLTDNLSEYPMIPAYMASQPFTILTGQVYSVKEV